MSAKHYVQYHRKLIRDALDPGSLNLSLTIVMHRLSYSSIQVNITSYEGNASPAAVYRSIGAPLPMLDRRVPEHDTRWFDEI